jgi:hypothetical protein
MPTIKSELSSKNYPSPQMRQAVIPHETEANVNIDYDAINAIMKERGMPPISPQTLQNAPQMAPQAPPPSFQDIEKQVKQARIDKAEGRASRLSPAAKQRIEMLCGMSRLQKETTLDNQKYILQSLRGKEQEEIWVAAAESQGSVAFPFELRKQTLARSLIHVAGADIDLFLGTSDMDAKLELMDSLPEELLNKLYQVFNELTDEHKKKYAIKTDKDAEEVSNDLKK